MAGDPKSFDEIMNAALAGARADAKRLTRRPVIKESEGMDEETLDLKVIKDGTEGVKGWAGSDGNYWAARYCDELPPGLYYPDSNNGTPYFRRTAVEADTILTLPDTAAPELLAEFREFWQLKPEFEERGFIHKRGFLLHGPPGSGKTALLRMMSKILIEEYNGIVLFIQGPAVAVAALRTMRATETERPIVALLEDFDALVARWDEAAYLALLDGEMQVGNIIFVATTNYPERLDRRFTARPGRFDTVREIGFPTIYARRAYFSIKEPELQGAELEHWLKLSDGFSIAHLREMILACRCLRRPIEEVCAHLRRGLERPPVSKDFDKKEVGFGSKR